MVGLLYTPQYMSPALDADGNPISGARLYAYANGTTTPQTTYADAGLTTPQQHPVVADAGGIFPLVYAPDGSTYSVAITDSLGAPLAAYDGVNVSTNATTANAALATAASNAANIANATLQSYLASIGGPGALAGKMNPDLSNVAPFNLYQSTFPTSYYSINVGEAGKFCFGREAYRSIGQHQNIVRAARSIEVDADGSGVQSDPNSADVALSLRVSKTAVGNAGELDGLDIGIRNYLGSGGDVGAVLANVAGIQGSQFAFEGNTYQFNSAGSIVNGVDVELGFEGENGGTTASYGVNISSIAGALTTAYYGYLTAGTTLTNWLQFNNGNTGTVDFAVLSGGTLQRPGNTSDMVAAGNPQQLAVPANRGSIYHSLDGGGGAAEVFIKCATAWQGINPNLTAYIPTVTPTSGAFSSAPTVVAVFRQTGNSVEFGLNIQFPANSNGTGAGQLQVTLPPVSQATPIGNSAGAVSGIENALTGKGVVGSVDNNKITLRAADGSYPGGNGANIIVTGRYQSLAV